MAARPVVTVRSAENGSAAGETSLPAVFSAPLRHDIVKYAVAQISKNKRQAYGVQRRAGHKHSAESWGTGRAVSRIPRVSGGGSHACGAGAFGNMCRGGHMFAPTKVFRRWHVAVPRKIRRFAVASALAATASAPLVSARGHKIEKIPEVPLVTTNAIEEITKTKQAVEVLKALGAYDDAERVKAALGMRAGKGKMRNRRYSKRKGPMVVVSDAGSAARKAFRNIPGVEAVPVSSLSVLQLAPGGHLGRLVIWSENAFKALDGIYGTTSNETCPKKAKFRIPRSIMTNADVTTLVNRDEIQKVLRPKRENRWKAVKSTNPLRKRSLLKRISPHTLSLSEAVKGNQKKSAAVASKSRQAKRVERLSALRKLKVATNATKAAAAPKAKAKVSPKKK
eukprot:NODE_1556_length_1374_cov_223.646792_g1293_i0.p1 GENE.NODE_1556_length_1374_cov_223.646792_g1293_i0~~NODE_1556_length_1374_cov_223.646792_g1293_i0.p1  ORF type:complete len:394 (-),score=144.65 NODE_1556_length_1374_cov_223.646792_g1293_i0:134-1315(-)